MVADPVEGPEECVLEEGVARDTHTERQIGGGYRELEVGRAGGVEDPIDGPGGQVLARRGLRGIEISAADPVDGGPTPEILSEPPQQSDCPGAIGGPKDHPIQHGLPSTGRVLGTEAEVEDASADDLAVSVLGAPFIEVEAPTPFVVLGRHMGVP